ncbi:unnamed protein product, partial [Ectocarpus sp. 13 AM-2016]
EHRLSCSRGRCPFPGLFTRQWDRESSFFIPLCWACFTIFGLGFKVFYFLRLFLGEYFHDTLLADVCITACCSVVSRDIGNHYNAVDASLIYPPGLLFCA